MKFLFQIIWFTGLFGCIWTTAIGQNGKDSAHNSVYDYDNLNLFKNIQTARPNEVMVSRCILNNKKPSIRFELNRNDKIIANGKRSEIIFQSEQGIPIERWYRFSIYLPSSYVIDSVAEIVAQWHAIPDFSLGETWRSPPISLMIDKGHWKLVTLWASDSVNSNKTISGRERVDIGSQEKSRWIDWIFHIKFSYKNDGLLEVWKNGSMVYSRKGPNYYNDQKGPFFKLGIYKWEWLNKDTKSIVNQRVLYISNIKIGNEEATLEKMEN